MFFFFQEKDCIRVAHYVLEFRRVLFRSVNKPQSACARFVGGGKAGCPSYPLGIASRRVATASAACCPNCAMKPSSWPSATSAWRPAAMSAQPMQDRKSVVEGKSVSVRVDHGGRRIIKKKQTHQNTYTAEKNI